MSRTERQDMSKYLHPDDVEVMKEATVVALGLAKKIGEPVMVEPKRRPLADAALGLCNPEQKLISIVLRFRNRSEDGGGWWPKPLSKQEVFLTVAHEVAHLRFANHGPEFRDLERQLKDQVVSCFGCHGE